METMDVGGEERRRKMKRERRGEKRERQCKGKE